MNVIANGIILLATICLMECISWCIHKYLFHGPLWFIHKSHHQPKHSLLEWNDIFAIFFAGLSLYLMYIDRVANSYVFFIGVGISAYGCIYFVIHDWLIHQRVRAFRIKNRYILKLRKAHKIHHKNLGRENGRAFGLLFINQNVVVTDKTVKGNQKG